MHTRFIAACWFAVAWIVFLSSPCFSASCTVSRVLEGDLLYVLCSGKTISVRLAAIDAPEMSTVRQRPGQPFCERARLHLENRVLSRTVSMDRYGKDRHGRTLAVIFLNGANVNLEMVQAGLAEVYRGRSPERLDLTPYRMAEQEARTALRGIWALRDQYFSPRDWREMHGQQPYNS